MVIKKFTHKKNLSGSTFSVSGANQQLTATRRPLNKEKMAKF